jgi:hypothetical protein
MCYLLLSHGNNVYTNVPRGYITLYWAFCHGFYDADLYWIYVLHTLNKGGNLNSFLCSPFVTLSLPCFLPMEVFKTCNLPILYDNHQCLESTLFLRIYMVFCPRFVHDMLCVLDQLCEYQ